MKHSATAVTIIALGCFAVATAIRGQPGPATLRPPPETVIVTAPKALSGSVIDHFVMSHASPSPLIDKIARWKAGICPITAGLPAVINRFVTRRVKAVAAMIGAPVQAEDACKPNIDIVFTTRPQALLDEIRMKHAGLLGYHDVSQSERLATVSHPIQAWYASETEDLNGLRSVDNEQRNRGVEMQIDPSSGCTGCSVFLPYAREERVEATRLGDGLRSELYHVSVVVDWHAVDGDEIGPLADYIAMLALSQTIAFDTCQDIPSITNLMSPDCDESRKPSAITDMDLAYLRALYKMDPGATLLAQRGQIVQQMMKTLEVH